MMSNVHSVVNSTQVDLLKPNPLRLAAILYWAISSAFKSPKSALICANKQSMAAKFAEAAGFDVVNILPKALLQHHGYWIYERALAIGYEPTICAEVSRDALLVSKVMAGFSDMGKAPLLVKQRTIDEQYSGLHKLDWLHIEDDSPHLLLAGALVLLERDKPIVTLSNILSNDALNNSIAIITRYGYQCFDHTLERIDASAASVSDISSECFFIHENEFILETIRNITGFDGKPLLNSQSGSQVESSKRYYNALLNYNSPTQKLLSRYLLSDHQLVDIDIQLTDGFYACEYYGDEQWNWSGPSSQSKLLVAVDVSGEYRFRALILALPEQVQSLPLYVFVDGELCATAEIKENTEIAFDFTVTQKSNYGAVEILFCIPNTVNIDGRSLGFSISNIKLYFKESELQ
jgi:hypothetical protein